MPWDRFIEWMTVDPVTGLLMTITAIVLFGASLAGAKDASPAFWPWLRRIIEASVGAALFLGLLWGFRSILNNNNLTFFATHGSLSNTSRESAQSIWGRPHVQQELSVSHFIEKVVQEEVPREDPTKPPIYVDKTVREEVSQNSLQGFNGQFDLVLNEREKGYALYAGYVINARLDYDVINDSDLQTEADFSFPLSPGQTLFENFKILVDNQDISPLLRFSPDLVQWTNKMQAHQRSKVDVTYSSRGMDTFYYQVPVQRELKNFQLVVTIDRLPVSLLNYPDGVLSPTQIQPTQDKQGSILTWKLDHAVTTAGMGVSLLQPEQPGAQVLRVLVLSPYTLTLLVTMLALTLLILREKVQFLQLALLAGVYCVQFLIMSAISDYAFGFWGSMIVGALLTLAMTFLLFRKYSLRLVKALVYFLVAFFTLGYPLAGLLRETPQLNAFDNLIWVGLIAYIFGLSLYAQTRLRVGETAINQPG